MDRVATVAVIDPDHHQPSVGRGPTDHLMRLASDKLGLDPICVVKRLFNFCNRDVAFGVIGA